MALSVSEKIKKRKEEKRQKLAKIKQGWYKRKKELKKECKVKKQPSKDALRMRAKRHNVKENTQKIREQTKQRVRKFRTKKKINTHIIRDSKLSGHFENSFTNRTMKHRAMTKFINNLPKSPNKRASVVSAYLQRNSPTVKTLVNMKRIPSPEIIETIKINESLVKDMKTAISSVKHKRSDDARATMNVLCASVSGSSIEKDKCQKKVAKRLGLPVRRISGGKAIRHHVLQTEKSSWTVTKRKTRNDRISDEDKQTAYDFWIDPQNARPTGNKNDIKRVRIGPKLYSSHNIYILEKTQSEVFLAFKHKYCTNKMCQRTFERCKPYYVLAVRTKDRQTCCCRYHIEARTLFKSCMGFRKRIFQTIYNGTEPLPVYEHLSDLINCTMCNKENDSNDIKCINRECENCGINRFKILPEEQDMSEASNTVNWSRYEYTKLNVKSKEIKKLCLINKNTSPGEMFNYFKEILVTFPSHQFRANWQADQMKHLIQNLPSQHFISVHDFSENFSCFEKNELQTSYFQKTEVSLHVSVIYRHSILEYDGIDSTEEEPNIITEHFFVISPDQLHDNHFTFHVHTLISEYLRSISYNAKVVHEFTDGCQTQYKSRHCMGNISESSSKLKYNQIIRNYFESSHGKGPQDAAGGLVKHQASMAIIRGTYIIQSAKDLYEFALKHLQSVKNGTTCKRRIFRYVEEVPRDRLHRYKAVKGNRSIHQIITTNKTSELLVRKLSCYTCADCSEGEYLKCNNTQIGSTTKHLMKKELISKDSEQTDSSDDGRIKPVDLITKNSVLALYTDDENADYYLIKVVSGPETLKRNITDGWGIKHEKGAEVLKGHYFDRDYSYSDIKFNSVENILAFVPVLSVKHILFNGFNTNILTLTEDEHMDILSAME